MYVKIKLEIFLEILYFLDYLVRHTKLDGGGDFSRLSRLIWRMAQDGNLNKISEKEFPSIRGIVKNFQRIEMIEKEQKNV